MAKKVYTDTVQNCKTKHKYFHIPRSSVAEAICNSGKIAKDSG